MVVGASAGGIEALSTLVGTLPADFPAPIVIAQHLDPRRASHLGEILSRRSILPVRTAEQHEPLQPGTVYVVPANRHVEITDHSISVSQGESGSPKPSINLLFKTAARVFGEGLIAVVLTGTGSDGADGARDVKWLGGTVVVQNPDTASYPALPQSLAPTIVDVVADLEDIGPLLRDLLADGQAIERTADERQLRTFLDQLRECSGIDFGHYKLPTIMRRLQRRMVATGNAEFREYVRFVQRHPDEYQHLVNSFLIKVTEFFRDDELFAYIRDQVLPALIQEARARDNQLRLWSAGCATGEEAYSLAILVLEVLGDAIDELNVRIFATDLDLDAVAFARRGIYPESALAGLPPELVERYFSVVDGSYEVKKRVRGLVIFGQHDLGQRAPFPRIDLALCRNVLIYFTTELQRRALHLFAFSLREGGYLALGKAETVSPLAELFEPEHLQLKVYRRLGDRVLLPPVGIRDSAPSMPIRLSLPRRSSGVPNSPLARLQRETARVRSLGERFDTVLLKLPVGVVVVDRRYDIQTLNNAARRLLGIHTMAVGEDFIHLVQAVPTGPLRALIDAAFEGTARSEILEAQPVDAPLGEPRYLQVSCHAEELERSNLLQELTLVVIADVTAAVRARRELEQALELQQAEAATAGAQVQRLVEANRQLVAANQELATVNAELRSANEELLVAHEEVQAATEEVETLNEELQATVEELNTTNDDLQERSVELQDTAVTLEEQRRASEAEQARLTAILLCMSDAVLLVDGDGRRVLTNAAYDRLFGVEGELIPEDGRGRPLRADQTPQQRAARGESFSLQFALGTAEGVRRSFEASGNPIRADRPSDGGVVVIRDITERSLRRLQEEFLALASHELRTPLTALQGFLQLVVREARADRTAPSTRQYAEQALTQARRIARLVNDLVDVERLQSGKLSLALRPLDLVPLVTRAVEVAQSLTQTQSLSLELPTTPLEVDGDEGRLEQVLLNLLTNAISYAPDSREIAIRLRRVDEAAEIQIQDSGPGIPAANLPNLFTRFFQVARTEGRGQGGLGLGLFIVHELVTAHGGTIDVDSKEGDGTTFTIRLPLLPSGQ